MNEGTRTPDRRDHNLHLRVCLRSGTRSLSARRGVSRPAARAARQPCLRAVRPARGGGARRRRADRAPAPRALRAQPAQATRVERTESGAVGELVILGRVVAAAERAGASNGRCDARLPSPVETFHDATIRPGKAVTQGHQTDIRRSLGAFAQQSPAGFPRGRGSRAARRPPSAVPTPSRRARARRRHGRRLGVLRHRRCRWGRRRWSGAAGRRPPRGGPFKEHMKDCRLRYGCVTSRLSRSARLSGQPRHVQVGGRRAPFQKRCPGHRGVARRVCQLRSACVRSRSGLDHSLRAAPLPPWVRQRTERRRRLPLEERSAVTRFRRVTRTHQRTVRPGGRRQQCRSSWRSSWVRQSIVAYVERMCVR